MGPTWDPPGSCRPQMGPMNLAIRDISRRCHRQDRLLLRLLFRYGRCSTLPIRLPGDALQRLCPSDFSSYCLLTNPHTDTQTDTHTQYLHGFHFLWSGGEMVIWGAVDAKNNSVFILCVCTQMTFHHTVCQPSWHVLEIISKQSLSVWRRRGLA